MKNTIKTVLLLTALSALFLFVGYALGGRSGVFFAFIMSLVMNFGAYWFSDKIVLKMHQAEPLLAGSPSGVYEIVQELCSRSALPMPKVYLVPDDMPNAFATGRNPANAAVAVTRGIVQILDKRELRGVLAHEISHIQNRDILISTMVATIASAVMYLANMLQWSSLLGGSRGDQEGRGSNPIATILTIVIAPLAAMMIQMAISRSREFMADESAALFSEDPEALASALEKISLPKLSQKAQRDESSPETQPAFAHLYIVNHFSGATVQSWFSTHPPVEERVKRLLALKRSR